VRIAVLFGRMCLSFRGTLDLATHRTDPRGLTGSELGCIRIAQCLRDASHSVALHTVSAEQGTTWEGIQVRGLDEPIEHCDAVIAINEPDLLRAAPAGAFRVCAFWLNDVSFCKVGFDNHVDLFCSPSAPHLAQIMTNESWRAVEKTPEHPNGKATYVPDPAKWAVVPLGCDPERYAPRPYCETCGGFEDSDTLALGCDHDWITQEPWRKIPGRVIYASSPDRGLHHLLGQWPRIKRAVPHATLHVFYRLEPWLRGFDNTPFFPPIEPLRARANYVEECLRRFNDRGGMGVTLRDSVSRETIELEMAQAEVLAFPVDTTTWSEGFSCTTLEACAAGAVPVITDCDAMGEVYAESGAAIVRRTGDWVRCWGDAVITALSLDMGEQREKLRAFAAERTWKLTAERIVGEIEKRRNNGSAKANADG
jgi:glycosyltransferase involved in cell wall biosynthesis